MPIGFKFEDKLTSRGNRFHFGMSESDLQAYQKLYAEYGLIDKAVNGVQSH